MFFTKGVLYYDLSVYESFAKVVETFASIYWLPMIIFILGNAFLEIAGPIYWNMKGVMSLEELVRATEDNSKK